MSDHKAFNDHIEKLLFIKRLQARENLFDKFLTGDGVLPSGGGLSHGLGLGSGGGIDNGGFKNRRPAIKEQMLSTTKDDDVIQADENMANLSGIDFQEIEDEHGKVVKLKAKDDKGKTKTVKLNGKTKSVWNVQDVDDIEGEAKEITENFNEVQHDPKNFKGTTSKAVIFEKDGVISKFKSISELSKSVGMSKYQILKDFKPKKKGDTFFHEKLGGNLTFVNRNDLKNK